MLQMSWHSPTTLTPIPQKTTGCSAQRLRSIPDGRASSPATCEAICGPLHDFHAPPTFDSDRRISGLFGRFCERGVNAEKEKRYGLRTDIFPVTGLIWTVAKLAGLMPSDFGWFSWWIVRNQFPGGTLLPDVTVPLGRIVKDL
jgi:hypothetical protein